MCFNLNKKKIDQVKNMTYKETENIALLFSELLHILKITEKKHNDISSSFIYLILSNKEAKETFYKLIECVTHENILTATNERANELMLTTFETIEMLGYVPLFFSMTGAFLRVIKELNIIEIEK